METNEVDSGDWFAGDMGFTFVCPLEDNPLMTFRELHAEIMTEFGVPQHAILAMQRQLSASGHPLNELLTPEAEETMRTFLTGIVAAMKASPELRRALYEKLAPVYEHRMRQN